MCRSASICIAVSDLGIDACCKNGRWRRRCQRLQWRYPCACDLLQRLPRLGISEGLCVLRASESILGNFVEHVSGQLGGHFSDHSFGIIMINTSAHLRALQVDLRPGTSFRGGFILVHFRERPSGQTLHTLITLKCLLDPGQARASCALGDFGFGIAYPEFLNRKCFFVCFFFFFAKCRIIRKSTSPKIFQCWPPLVDYPILGEGWAGWLRS